MKEEQGVNEIKKSIQMQCNKELSCRPQSHSQNGRPTCQFKANVHGRSDGGPKTAGRRLPCRKRTVPVLIPSGDFKIAYPYTLVVNLSSYVSFDNLTWEPAIHTRDNPVQV